MSTKVHFICPKCNRTNYVDIPIDTHVVVPDFNMASYRQILCMSGYGSISTCYNCRANLELKIPDQLLTFEVKAYDPSEPIPGL